jgi:hypothetical protein
VNGDVSGPPDDLGDPVELVGINLVHYSGIDQHGQSFSGDAASPFDLAQWVKDVYDAGCLMLEVRQGDLEIAGIGRDPHSGERTWWAETQAPAA